MLKSWPLTGDLVAMVTGLGQVRFLIMDYYSMQMIGWNSEQWRKLHEYVHTLTSLFSTYVLKLGQDIILFSLFIIEILKFIETQITNGISYNTALTNCVLQRKPGGGGGGMSPIMAKVFTAGAAAWRRSPRITPLISRNSDIVTESKLDSVTHWKYKRCRRFL
jgi:hypothetical protein